MLADVLTCSTMPARGDCYWRKSDNDPGSACWPRTLTASGRRRRHHSRTVTGNVTYFSAERNVVPATPARVVFMLVSVTSQLLSDLTFVTLSKVLPGS
jgi:hypothetical protein